MNSAAVPATRFQVRLALGHRRHDVRLVIGLAKFGGAVGFEVGPAPLVFELSVQSLPAFGLFLGVEQRIDGPLVDGNVGAIRDFEQAQHMLRLFLHPLISADGGDAEDVKLLGLQEHENRLLVAGSGTPSVLVDDDFDFLGGGRRS